MHITTRTNSQSHPSLEVRHKVRRKVEDVIEEDDQRDDEGHLQEPETKSKHVEQQSKCDGFKSADITGNQADFVGEEGQPQRQDEHAV